MALSDAELHRALLMQQTEEQVHRARMVMDIDNKLLECLFGFTPREVPREMLKSWMAECPGLLVNPVSLSPMFGVQPAACQLAVEKMRELGYSVEDVEEPLTDQPPSGLYTPRCLDFIEVLLGKEGAAPLREAWDEATVAYETKKKEIQEGNV